LLLLLLRRVFVVLLVAGDEVLLVAFNVGGGKLMMTDDGTADPSCGGSASDVRSDLIAPDSHAIHNKRVHLKKARGG